MAAAPILQLSDISLTFGGNPLFDGVDLVVQPQDKLTLVGRNGSGKSTLMKLMAGLIEADTGSRILSPGVAASYMQQEPDFTSFSTLEDFAISDLSSHESFKVEQVAEKLKLDLKTLAKTASGGEKRRAALVKILAEAPDLMLLDEPTNHLDIEAIAWLENYLAASRSALIVISHDRAFLRRVTKATLWLDRGVVRRQDARFERFEEWRDKTWEEEDLARHKLSRKIKAEARWAVEGISARRKRNMGRVRALQELRADRSSQIKRQGVAAMEFGAGPKSGRQVITANSISKTFDNKLIFKDFSIKIARGEKVALVGPNGAGKTTLLNVLVGQTEAETGSVKHGTNLEIVIFDQNRATLKPDDTLWESLTDDPISRVKGRSDHVMVRGQPRHVVGYLKDFLFDEGQARAPIRSLSGGERARLILARLMARDSNLLVLDEPTNDLDIETLDLLQELISDYDGTVLVVSHDRDFLDRVATRTIYIRDGNTIQHAGGWSDIEPLIPEVASSTVSATKRKKPKDPAVPQKTKAIALSFTEKHRFEELPAEIDRLTAEISKLEEFMADPELFSKEPLKFKKATEALVERQKVLQSAEEEWLSLAEKAESES